MFLVKGEDSQAWLLRPLGRTAPPRWENLLPGVYEVSEKLVPSPYLPDANPSTGHALPEPEPGDVYFENHKRPTVTIQKRENSVTHDLHPVRRKVPHHLVQQQDADREQGPGHLPTDEARSFWRASRTLIIDHQRDQACPLAGQLPEDLVTEVYVKGGENKTINYSNIPLSAPGGLQAGQRDRRDLPAAASS